MLNALKEAAKARKEYQKLVEEIGEPVEVIDPPRLSLSQGLGEDMQEEARPSSEAEPICGNFVEPSSNCGLNSDNPRKFVDNLGVNCHSDAPVEGKFNSGDMDETITQSEGVSNSGSKSAVPTRGISGVGGNEGPSVRTERDGESESNRVKDWDTPVECEVTDEEAWPSRADAEGDFDLDYPVSGLKETGEEKKELPVETPVSQKRRKKVLMKKGKRVRIEKNPTVVPVESVSAKGENWWKRTRAFTAALKKKNGESSSGGATVGSSAEPCTDTGLEELERKAAEAERKRKGKRNVVDEKQVSKPVSKKKQKKSVPTDKNTEAVEDDGFVANDATDEEEKDSLVKRKPTDRLRVNDSRTRIHNRRIAKGVKEVATDGVVFNDEENEARWKFVCLRKIVAEIFLSDHTLKNQTYVDILEKGDILKLMKGVDKHYPQLVREFICNMTADITEETSPMYFKVKVRDCVVEFSPTVINRWYDYDDGGTSGSTLALDDIISELSGGTLKKWPLKGQLQASSLSLRYSVLHKASIANLVPTSNSSNVVEVLAKMLYVMGSDLKLDVGGIIFDQIVDHAKTGAKLKPIGFPSLICNLILAQYPDILLAKDGYGVEPASLTISEKLMKGRHFIDIDLPAVETSEPTPVGDAAHAVQKVYEDELKVIEAEIQVKSARASELRRKIAALQQPSVIPSVMTADPNAASASGAGDSTM